MIIDSKKLWIEGGYGLHNDYEISLARVRQEAKRRGVSDNDLDLILIDFFISLREDPKKYRTERNICEQCSCEGTNSGTNAIHYLFKKIEEKQVEMITNEQDRFGKALNEKIITYVEKDNADYVEKYGPKTYKWYEMPTFKKMLGIK